MAVVTKKLTPMERARARISSRHVFFAALVLSTPFLATNQIPTAATDMVKVYYNEKFIELLTPDELIFVVVHEIMHILLKHGLRRGSRDHELWNIACDHAINLKLQSMKFTLINRVLGGMTKPFRVYADPRFTGMHTEEVYTILKQEQDAKTEPQDGGDPEDSDDGDGEPGGGQPRPGKGKPGSSFHNDLLPPPATTPVEARKIADKIDRDVARAVTIAKSRGQMPAELVEIVDEYFSPQIPWETLLRRFATQYTRANASWTTRNRRITHVVLPGKHSKTIGQVVVVGDSSGSMFDKKIFQFVGNEINAIIQSMKPDVTRVVWADDAECSNQDVFKRGDKVVLHPKGGGGTDMRKPLRYIEQFKPLFAILITDGFTPWPEVKTPYPLIICCTTNVDCPSWAMTVRVQIED